MNSPPTGPVVLAVDVGGTSIKAAVVDANGGRSQQIVLPTPAADGPEAVVAAIRSTVTAACAGASAVAAVGVVVPGAVDTDKGIARYAANLGWRDVPLRQLLADATGLPTVLGHDVGAAGLAETTIGAARGHADSLVTVIGTGIAGVLTAGGHRLDGATGLAGEIGHLPVRPDGEACPCGQRGCLERYASAAAIGRHYFQSTGRRLDAGEVVDRLGTDPDAATVWTTATDALGSALASYTMLLDPALIVLGGGLARAGVALLGPVRAAVAERVAWRACPAVELSPLGARMGLFGAAILAFRALGVVDFSAWSPAVSP